MFRHAHRSLEHAQLAAHASLLWDEMAGQLPHVEQPLLARIGALHTMPNRNDLAPLEQSLAATERDYEVLTTGSLAQRWPGLWIEPPIALLDPRGGRIEAAAAIRALRDDLADDIVFGRIDEVAPDGAEVRLRTGSVTLTARSVVVCAGLDTPQLVKPAGIGIQMDRPLAATRLTFRPLAGETPDIPCIHERGGSLPETISYLFPGEWGGVSIGLPSLPEMLTQSLLRRIEGVLTHALPGAEWVREAEVAARVEVLDDADHDRIEVHRAGQVWAVAGWNLFKHAPAVGEGIAALLAGQPAPLLERLPGERSGDLAAADARRTSG